MQIISDRRKTVSTAIGGKFGRNSQCVLALVTRTCKRLESGARFRRKKRRNSLVINERRRVMRFPALCSASFAEIRGDTLRFYCDQPERSPVMAPSALVPTSGLVPLRTSDHQI
jgi:hypothetical protein